MIMGSGGDGKRTSRQVIRLIADSLKTGPKSILEVSSETGVTWESAKRYLETLKEIGVAEEEGQDRKRIFRLKSCVAPPDTRSDTLFGLPVSPEHEDIVNFLFMNIRETWKEKTGSYPGKTQVQKVLTEVAYRCNVDIPIGWYRFGELCIVTYDPVKEYAYPEIENKGRLLSSIRDVVDEDKGYNASYLKKKQYIERKNLLYLRYYDFDRNLLRVEMNEENRTKMIRMLLDLNVRYNKDEYNFKAAKILDDFISTTIYILKNLKTGENDDILDYVKDTLNSVWEMIATHNLFSSLAGKKYYSKEQLLQYLDMPLKLLENIADERVGCLRELSKIDELTASEFHDYKELESKIATTSQKTLSREERKRVAEDFAKTDTSDIFRELDVD